MQKIKTHTNTKKNSAKKILVSLASLALLLTLAFFTACAGCAGCNGDPNGGNNYPPEPTKLTTPTVTLNLHTSTISWVSIQNATGYRVEFSATGNQEIENINLPTTQTTVLLTDYLTDGGNYTIKIFAVGDGTYYIDSYYGYANFLVATHGLFFTHRIAFDGSNSYSVSRGDATDQATIYIPTFHNGRYITAICPGGFVDMQLLTRVYAPSTFEFVGENVFMGSDNFLSNPQNVDRGVIYMGNWAISPATGAVGNLIIRNGTVGIASNAFRAAQFTTVTMPNTLQFIGRDAFRDSNLATSPTIPSSVVSIGRDAFLNATFWPGGEGIAIIVGNWVVGVGGTITMPYNSLPSTIVGIADDAFFNQTHSGFTALYLPLSIEHMGQNAFNPTAGGSSLALRVAFSAAEENRPTWWRPDWNNGAAVQYAI